MNFYIMTLFPEMVMDGLNTSIIGRAVNNGLLSIEALNIRDYAFNKHHSVDDYPYGGGAGMLMQAEPVYQCYDALARQIRERKAGEERSGEQPDMAWGKKRTRVIYLSPQGKTFNQSMAEEFAQEEDLVFLCGHYEGIDERVLEEIVTDYPDWFLECSIMTYLPNSKAFRIICWNTRSIPDRKCGMTKKYRRY